MFVLSLTFLYSSSSFLIWNSLIMSISNLVTLLRVIFGSDILSTGIEMRGGVLVC